MKEKVKIFIIPHTHWDRAWYLTYEEFRAGLLKLFPFIFRFLSKKDNPPFLLDGQTSIIEDYLELKPEDGKLIKKLIKTKRLLVGPFYIQVDNILSHPEALIRNLLTGFEIAKKYGHITKIGYFPDTWGLTLQLPQILKSFGINNIIFGRGYKEDIFKTGVEFFWEGIDKTKMLAIFMPHGYINGINLGYPVKWGDTSSLIFNKNLAIKDLMKESNFLFNVSNTPYLLIMNGGDHIYPSFNLYEIIRDACSIYKLNIDNRGIEKYLRGVKNSSKHLSTYKGYLRYGRYSYIVSGTISSRIYLKQKNNQISKVIVNYIEPLLSYALITGAHIEHSLLNRAWKLILQNLAHDEIGGCSIDAVHKEMLCRYDKAAQILKVLRRTAQRIISYNFYGENKRKQTHIIFNPSNARINSIVKTSILIDKKMMDADNFIIRDIDGNPIEFQILNTKNIFSMEINSGMKRLQKDIVLKVTNINPFGFKTIQVTKANKVIQKNDNSKINNNNPRIETNFFVLEVRSSSIRLENKMNGKHYEGFLYISDEEDAGDEYNYSPLINHSEIKSTKIHGKVSWIHKGPLYYSIKESILLPIPETIDWKYKKRSDHIIFIPIELYFSAFVDSQTLEINIKIKNKAENHRMRLNLILNNIDFTNHIRGSHFCYEKMKTNETHIDTKDWKEALMPTDYFHDFVACYSDVDGIMIITKDTNEYEVKNNGEISFTLFRAVGDLSRNDLITRKGGAGFSFPTPEAQCKIILEYSFGLHMFSSSKGVPHDLYKVAESFLNPPITFPFHDPPGIIPGEIEHADVPDKFEINEPKRKTIFSDLISVAFQILTSQIILAAFKPLQDENGYIMRLVNYSNSDQKATIKFLLIPKVIKVVNLNEDELFNLSFKDKYNIEIEFHPFEIKTLKVIM